MAKNCDFLSVALGFDVERGKSVFFIEEGNALDQPGKAFGRLFWRLRMQVIGRMCGSSKLSKKRVCGQSRLSHGRLIHRSIRNWNYHVIVSQICGRRQDQFGTWI